MKLKHEIHNYEKWKYDVLTYSTETYFSYYIGTCVSIICVFITTIIIIIKIFYQHVIGNSFLIVYLNYNCSKIIVLTKI